LDIHCILSDVGTRRTQSGSAKWARECQPAQYLILACGSDRERACCSRPAGMIRTTFGGAAWHRRRSLALYFAGWLRAVLLSLRMAIQALKLKAAGEAAGLWQKTKEELVQGAVRFLGWTREDAQAQTVGQLRLYLKELQNELTATRPEFLPKGMAKMSKAELQEEMQKRRLTHSGMTREQMMRDLRIWAQEAEQGGVTGDLPDHVPKATATPTTNFPNIIASMRGATSSTMGNSTKSTRAPGTSQASTALGGTEPGDCWMYLGDSAGLSDSSSMPETVRMVVEVMTRMLLAGAARPDNVIEKATQMGLMEGIPAQLIPQMAHAAAAEAFNRMQVMIERQ